MIRAAVALSYLVTILTLLIIGCWGIGALRNDPVQRPFDAYADYMPGNVQPIGHGFSCDSVYEYTYSPPGTFYCTRYMETSPVRWISVSGDNGVITRTAFGLRGFRVGDLVAVYGRADSTRLTAYSVTMEWRGVYAYGGGRRAGRRVTMTTAIRYVSFEGVNTWRGDR